MPIAFLSVFLLLRWFSSQTDEKGRFASIDGLRGYLAFLVFLHHSCIWYFYLRTGLWRVPPSDLYTNFGQCSVALFFMITGFLFFSKLLESRNKQLDWDRLFVSRLMRLGPLYLFAMLAMFAIVAVLSKGALNVSGLYLSKTILQWATFTILGAPGLNGIEQTNAILGVAWSLVYEWFFYLSLPLLSLCVGAVPPVTYLLVGVACVATIFAWGADIYPLASFLGGIVAAVLVRSEKIRSRADRPWASVLVILLLAAAFTLFPTAYAWPPLFLLSLAFVLIACGNNMFGLLSLPSSRGFGELAYGIYLLHCIVLFVLFRFVVGFPKARMLSAVEHWTLVICVTPVLLVICFVAFRAIEYPAMKRTERVTNWLRAGHTIRLGS